MIKKFLVFLQHLIPQHFCSRLFARLADSRIKWLKNLLINWFIKHYRIDLQSAIKQRAEDFASFNEFFIRQLKPGARPLATEKNAVISPVDGSLSQWGEISQGRLIQAKGFDYSLESLLADSKFAANFVSGQFATLYLSPKDYHRVHMPFAGELLEMTYVPGNLFAVNTATTNQIPAIFAKNERVICIFNTEIGKMAVILVGALLVAGIHTAWAGKVTPNQTKTVKSISYEGLSLARGEELGYFCMGSTVIVLFEPQRVNFAQNLVANQAVKYGEKIATLIGCA